MIPSRAAIGAVGWDGYVHQHPALLVGWLLHSSWPANAQIWYLAKTDLIFKQSAEVTWALAADFATEVGSWIPAQCRQSPMTRLGRRQAMGEW